MSVEQVVLRDVDERVRRRMQGVTVRVRDSLAPGDEIWPAQEPRAMVLRAVSLQAGTADQ